MSNTILTPEQQAKTISLIKYKIIPFAFLLQLFNVIDRVNIGFAALTMNQELNISDIEYGTIAAAFFMTYLVFQIPSNMLLPFFGAKHWIGFLFTTWGAITAASFFATSGTYILVTRFLMGVFEAGFFPGMIFYIATWFPERDRGHASALFIMAGTFAQLIAAPLSGFIVENANFLGYAGWRWIFMIAGVATMLVGISIFFFLTNTPEEAKWLDRKQKDWLINKIEREKAAQLEKSKNNATIKDAIWDVNLWKLALTHMFFQGSVLTAIYWLPKQLKSFHPDLADSHIGYVMGAALVLGMLLSAPWGKHSDTTGERRWHTMLPIIVSSIGFIGAAYFSYSLYAQLFFLSLYGVGFIFFGPFWSVPPTLLSPTMLAVGIAFINSFAGLGLMLANKIIGYIQEYYGSAYSLYFQAALGFIAVAIFLTLRIEKPEKKARTEANQPVVESA